MTKLTKAISRETNKVVGRFPVVITVAPGSGTREDMIGLRLKGKRTQYVCTLSDIYRLAALWHGQKEAIARRAARREGVSWHTAKKQFDALNKL